MGTNPRTGGGIMSFDEPCLCFIAKEPCDPDVKCLVFWKAAAKKALPFCISCPDDTKGAVLYGMCKDIARMAPLSAMNTGTVPLLGA